MAMNWKIPGAFIGFWLAAGCVVYPYETAFSSCDGEAGICYRYCEEFAGTPESGACRAACEDEANQCFASAYGAYQYSGAQYSSAYSIYPPPPWNGRYGSWYPDYGYRYSYGYYGQGYGYGPRRPRNPHYGYGGGGRRHPSGNPPTGGSGSSGGGQPPPPPQAQPPKTQPPANAGRPPPGRKQPPRTPRTKDNPVRDKD